MGNWFYEGQNWFPEGKNWFPGGAKCTLGGGGGQKASLCTFGTPSSNPVDAPVGNMIIILSESEVCTYFSHISVMNFTLSVFYCLSLFIKKYH